MKQIIIILILISTYSYSQKTYSTKSKRAIKMYEKARIFYNNYDTKNALFSLEKAIKYDEHFVEAYWMSGDIYNKINNTEKELEFYKKATQAIPHFSSQLYFELGEAYFRNGKYDEALEAYTEAKTFENLNPRIIKSLDKGIKRSTYCSKAIKNPVPFNPINMGNNVNTKYDDYWPLITADEEVFYTTKMIPVDMNYPLSRKNRQEDFFMNKKQVDNNWGKLYHLSKPLNTKLNEGAPSISADGQWFYFTACQRPDGKGKCDIYKTRKTGNRWETPINLGSPVNTGAWESQPSVTADGRTLYFVSNRRGTKGKMDIWVSNLQNDGKWTTPKNLGDTINSYGKEMSPFIHPDGKTLYFTSDEHIGFGDQDIFMSRKDKNGNWSKPMNLGYPINTAKEERGLFINNKGDYAYLTASRDGNEDLDIYKFELYPAARPTPSTYVTGIVRNLETKKVLEAKFELIDLSTNKIVTKNVSDKETGKYLVVLPVDKEYAFNVQKTGYLPYSDNFVLPADFDINQPFIKNIELQPIKIGKEVVLKNIFFELDSYELKQKSIAELTKLIEFLNDNPTVKIELGGHTDNQGTRKHNEVLSDNRAKTVYTYLIENGVDSKRLTFKGYGQDKPIDTNNTKEGRAKNRRTEFKVTDV